MNINFNKDLLFSFAKYVIVIVLTILITNWIKGCSQDKEIQKFAERDSTLTKQNLKLLEDNKTIDDTLKVYKAENEKYKLLISNNQAGIEANKKVFNIIRKEHSKQSSSEKYKRINERLKEVK